MIADSNTIILIENNEETSQSLPRELATSTPTAMATAIINITVTIAPTARQGRETLLLPLRLAV